MKNIDQAVYIFGFTDIPSCVAVFTFSLYESVCIIEVKQKGRATEPFSSKNWNGFCRIADDLTMSTKCYLALCERVK